MKNKIIVSLAVVLLFSATFVFAGMPGESHEAYLTLIIENQQETSAWLEINFEDEDTWEYFDDFRLYTEPDYPSDYQNIVLDTLGPRYWLHLISTEGGTFKNFHCISDNPEDAFEYPSKFGVIFTPIENENIVCTLDNSLTKDPVLIVPGLVGTKMEKGGELLWPNMGKMFQDVGDEFMDPLAFNQSLLPSDLGIDTLGVVGDEKILGVTVFDYSKALIDEFVGQGYVENESLFTFPYDWRYGVSGVNLNGKTNSDLLGEKINAILQQTGADKIDVVAHSMGGLVVKKYVANNALNNKIDKAVFVGVPNTGAPKAVKGLLQGDDFGIPWLAESEIKKISENMPSAYDLLPSREYYNVKGDSFIEVVNRTSLFTSEIKNLNYEESKSFLVDDHGLNSLAMSNAENLHTETFDNFDMRTAGVDVYSINGCKAGTLGKVVEVRAKDALGGDYVTYNKPKEVPGDNTVPFESATNLPIDQNNKYYALKAFHGRMLSQDGARQQIVNLISDSDLRVGDNLITQDINQCQLNGKAISVFSPINIFITDQAGNRIGLAEDGSLINEIPNADFQVWGSPSNPAGRHKFVYLPTDNGQVYNIGINGTGNGTYTIKTDDIQNSQTIKTEVFSNLPVTTALLGQISLSGATTTLVLDVDGNGTTDQSVEPSAVLSGAEAEDLIPPVSEATIVGEQKKPVKKIISWIKGKKQDSVQTGMEIKITADDPSTDSGQASGVLSISYNLDGAGYQTTNGSEVKINVSGEGQHKITFFSTDRAGNNETEQALSFEIKENKNRFKATILEIKNLIYNKLKINVDQNKTGFPWNLRNFIVEAELKDAGLKDTKIFKNITSKFNFSWLR